MGLHKTGTSTLGVCMERLGYRNVPFSSALLVDWAAGRTETALQVSDRYDSFQDWPWPLLLTELDARHPGSRFVLTVRADEAAWLGSLAAHAERSRTDRFRRIVYGHPSPVGHEDEHLAFYRAHNERVREHFSGRPDQLLEVCWERGDGWSELCAFLGTDVPPEPFPHGNRRPAWQRGER
ncbi:MAG: sulfotransferase family protein [Acidimicrobiales bacterium]